MGIRYLNVAQQTPQADEPPVLWLPPTVAEYVEQVAAVPDWLIEGILPADSKNLMSGKAKRAYKSWMAFAMAMAVASGKQVGPFKPVNPDGEGVLILEAEGSRARTKMRWQALSNGFGIPLQELNKIRFSHREMILLDDKKWVDRILEHMAKYKVRLVIIDPLAMFNRGDENSVQDMGEIMRAFTKFCEQGASILFIHHITKTSKDWTPDIDEEIRGSSALAGFYDVHYAIRKRRENQQYNELTIRGKDIEEKTYEVRWTINEHVSVPTATMSMVETSPEQKIKNLLGEMCEPLMMHGVLMTKARIGELLEINSHELADVIEKAIAEEVLEKVGTKFRLFEGSDGIGDDALGG